jgi:hypothetical protein
VASAAVWLLCGHGAPPDGLLVGHRLGHHLHVVEDERRGLVRVVRLAALQRAKGEALDAERAVRERILVEDRLNLAAAPPANARLVHRPHRTDELVDPVDRLRSVRGGSPCRSLVLQAYPELPLPAFIHVCEYPKERQDVRPMPTEVGKQVGSRKRRSKSPRKLLPGGLRQGLRIHPIHFA